MLSVIFNSLLARAESALEKQLKEEEKILESVAEKRGKSYICIYFNKKKVIFQWIATAVKLQLSRIMCSGHSLDM